MTIRFTDECPNCEKNLANFVEELDDKFYEPFICPYCDSTLEFKKGKYRIIAIIGGFLILALITYFVFYFEIFGISANYPSELKEFPMTITNILIMVIFGLLWIQNIKLIKPPSDDK